MDENGRGGGDAHHCQLWKHVGVRWLSPQAIVTLCLAVRKQQMGIAADQVEEWGMQSVICIRVQWHCLKEKEVAAVTTSNQLADRSLNG